MRIMTTKSDRRFTASVACLQGILTFDYRSEEGSKNERVELAVKYADALLAKLDESEPYFHSHKTECLHEKTKRNTAFPTHSNKTKVCIDCGEVLP